MATRLYGANPGFSLEQVVENVGPATTSNNVELNVDMNSAIVNDNGTTRSINALEVVLILELFKEYILREAALA